MRFRTDLRISLTATTMIVAALAFPTLGCNDNNDNPPDPPDPVDLGKVQVWLTMGDKTKLLSYVGELPIKETASTTWPIIVVDTATSFQEIEGFGAALTGSSAYNLHQKMNSTTRQTVLNALFDREDGIGISFLRLTMGASDFSLSDFTYDDMPSGQTDYGLENFSLAQDLEDVAPILQQIVQITPDIKLMGSPWSPPAWMKTNNSLKGGQLKPECYDVYGDYFVKYIQAMKDNGITISHVTPQNEPLHWTAGYPCMQMQATEQIEFIKASLGPSFIAAGIDSKIVVYDHNWDEPDYPITILNDPAAAQYVAGSAFHGYGGNVTAMSTVHFAHPDKDLYFTEISGGTWATDFSSNLMWNMRNIFIGTIQNWSKAAMLWNLVLDQYWGPRNNGCSNCRGVITYNVDNGNIIYNEEYYSIAHFSKFVRPGAKRVSSVVPSQLGDVGLVAFVNTDGSKAIVACNYTGETKAFIIQQDKKYFNYSLNPHSVATLVW
jgi:glucosylceramidase